MGNQLVGDADSTALILSFLDLHTTHNIAKQLGNYEYQESVQRSLKCGSLATVHGANWQLREEARGKEPMGPEIMPRINLFGASLSALHLRCPANYTKTSLTSEQLISILTSRNGMATEQAH
eukprot:TRINITY_DN67200_c6_g7_i1.p2 TRINITY_DN67200_c6_g7~~TRINITY_DN67200_c6_g7_i1.p2  ORF type:complete len:122 (-),score=12.17 TRINITY_DN67200_c6_g7_i1:467-832(-)